MHHAHLIIAPLPEGIAHARILFGVGEEAHPDLHVLTYETFGIDEARAMQSWAYQQPVARSERIFIIACDRITLETQNALLKLFEEPPRTSAFSLIVREAEMIIPTLRSRFSVTTLKGADDDLPARTFLGQGYAARLQDIASRTKAKDAAWQRALLAGLERHYAAAKNYSLLGEIASIERSIDARGASPKMLLEHLALTLPVA